MVAQTEKTSILHAATHEPMGARTLGYFDRVESVYLANQFYYLTEDHTDEIIRALKRFRYLKRIVIGGPSRLSSPPLADERIKKAMPSVNIVEFCD